MKAILAMICLVFAVFTVASPVAVPDAVDLPRGFEHCPWKDPDCKDWDWKEWKCKDKCEKSPHCKDWDWKECKCNDKCEKDPHCKDWDWKKCKCNDKHDGGKATVQLANDQSGANANQNVRTDGQWRSIGHLWKSTDIYEHGKVMVSSAMLTRFTQQTVCAIKDHSLYVEFNAQKTWVSLAGGAVKNLADGSIKCWD